MKDHAEEEETEKSFAEAEMKKIRNRVERLRYDKLTGQNKYDP